jgi:hypothetical protein
MPSAQEDHQELQVVIRILMVHRWHLALSAQKEVQRLLLEVNNLARVALLQHL